jgi:hypothetical protein
MKIKITKDNIDAVNRLLKELQNKQVSFVAQGGELIKSEMQMRCAHKSGKTIQSIQTQSYATDGGAESETGIAGKSMVPIYLEYGTGIHAVNGDGRKTPWTYYDEETDQFFRTHGMEAQPFAQPGFDAAKPGIDRLAETVLRV